MKLWYSPASPVVRKVIVTYEETGLKVPLEIVEVSTNAIASDANLRRVNPAGKVPALVLDDGSVLIDSRVICDYFDAVSEGTKLAPVDLRSKFRAKTLEALADAVMDAAVITRYELTLRPEQYRWEDWVRGQLSKVETSLDSLDEDWINDLNGPLTIGAIATGCALGYLDFRFAYLNWREGRPGLSSWYKEFSERPSMVKTAPKA
jgi:glutathione S-transferase